MGSMAPDPAAGSDRTPLLRDYQKEALQSLAERWQAGEQRTWLVLPPGSGKTLVGLTAARQLGRHTVVFVPNTAIQGQWIRQARANGHTAGADRDLGNEVSVLTYQSLAVFDPDVETDEEGNDRAEPATRSRGQQLLDRLHDNGRELVGRLRDSGPLTVILDECHHLLDVWGRLLHAVLDDLDDAQVIGLTGTPPTSLTRAEEILVSELFGEPVLGASTPALVRSGHLAAFAELAWLCEPDPGERSYIHTEAERFEELVTDLLAPGFAATDFLPWLDSRFTADSWPQLLRQQPRLTDAALRFAHAELLSLPPVARLEEQHRHRPFAEDWIEVLGDYVTGCLLPNEEQHALESIRAALPAIGYTLTKKGIRRSSSPVDRVLARSAAKTDAAVEIAALEATELGDRLRCLVLCDHERASATLPARLQGVLSSESGSARLMLERLVADPRTSELDPMLVTGRTVAAGVTTARAFAAWAIEGDLAPADLEVRDEGQFAVLEGSWTARRWVAAVTAFFAGGHSRVLIGTRALLGEGWDAPAVNVLVDSTTATTPTAVVQLRGRALRLDPDWPEKTAHTWSLVCASDQHPKGAADWDRFVRKHRDYLAPDPEGEIMAGVGHVHPTLSPYQPPPSSQFDRLNAQLVARARDRAGTRQRWRLGGEFRDQLVHVVRVRPDRADSDPDRAAPADADARQEMSSLPTYRPELVPAENGATPAPKHVIRPWPFAVAGAGASAGAIAAFTAEHASGLLLTLGGCAGLFSAALLAVERRKLIRRYRQALTEMANAPVLPRLAYALADGLAAAGLAAGGAENVRIYTDPDGDSRFSLVGSSTEASARFAAALDELVSAPAAPRYLIPRYLLTSDRVDRALVRKWLAGKAHAESVVYHAVPELFGNRAQRRAFTKAWNTWVSAGEPISTKTPEGTGMLAAHGGSSPLDVATASRVAWE